MRCVPRFHDDAHVNIALVHFDYVCAWLQCTRQNGLLITRERELA